MSSLPPHTWQGQSESLERTLAIGRAVAQHVRAGDVIGLIGELGAGKTQFVRGLAQGLGCAEMAVASPTFVLVHEYEPDPGSKPVLVHIDAYRLRSLEDLESIGWEPRAEARVSDLRRDAVVAVEWADRLGDLLGDSHLLVRLSHDETGRRIQIEATPAWESRWRALEQGLAHAQLMKLDDSSDSPRGKPSAAGMTKRACPMCKGPVLPESTFAPFCSKRCKLADLAKWMRGDYTISRPIEQADLDET